MLINNVTYQRETLSERPIRQPLIYYFPNIVKILNKEIKTSYILWICEIWGNFMTMWYICQ